jgi:hypothetical protein
MDDKQTFYLDLSEEKLIKSWITCKLNITGYPVSGLTGYPVHPKKKTRSKLKLEEF